MASNTPAQDDPKQLADAQNFWAAFTKGTKYSIIATVFILIALLLLFVPTGA